jgi:hypothetical protein
MKRPASTSRSSHPDGVRRQRNQHNDPAATPCGSTGKTLGDAGDAKAAGLRRTATARQARREAAVCRDCGTEPTGNETSKSLGRAGRRSKTANAEQLTPRFRYHE